MDAGAPMEIRARLDRSDVGGSEWPAGRHGCVSASQRRCAGALLAWLLDVRRAPEPPKSCGRHSTKPLAALTRFFTPSGPSLRLAESSEDCRVYLAEKCSEFDAETVERSSGHDRHRLKSAVAELTA
jgi:hypothetical protein